MIFVCLYFPFYQPFYLIKSLNRYNGEKKFPHENSDYHYMSDTEAANFRRKSITLPSGTLTFSTTTSSNDKSQDDLKFIKGDNLTFKNDLKVVKFVDTATLNEDLDSKILNRTSPYLTPNKNEYAKTNDLLKVTNDVTNGSENKYYSSNKVPLSSSLTTFNNSTKDIKKSFDVEASSTVIHNPNNSASLYSNNINFNSYSYNDLTYESPTNGLVHKSGSAKDLVYTPSSKPLQLEDFQFDKPNYNLVDTDLLNQVNQTNYFQHKQYNGNNNSNQQQQQSQHLNGSLTPEFNDCLQLLNEAESKIQNRSSPYVSKYHANTRPQSILNGSSGSQPTTSILKSSTILPDKYSRPQPHQRLASATESSSHNGNLVSNSKLQYSPALVSGSRTSGINSYENAGSYNNLSSYTTSRSRSVEPINKS